jgi:predicted RecA/RadA family phage recombinase
MNTYRNDGNRILYSNTGSAIAAGDIVIVRSGTSGVCGIAVTDIAATTGTGQLSVGGVHELPKVSGAITAGALVYRGTAGTVTTTSTSGTLLGYATAAATTAATTAFVMVNGNPG